MKTMDLQALRHLLGAFPDRCSLDAVVLETADCGLYVRQTVEYAVEANQRIRSFLLLPKRIDRPAPAIFAHHQHNREFDLGKSEVVGLAGDPDQAYAAELAQRGYVVIAPDALAFEERNWSYPSGNAEYYELATRLVQGRTLLAKCLHDVSVGLDYLLTRPEVDPARIGFIGHSYGGRMAIWAPAIDHRIQASVSNCGCVNYKQSFTHDAGVQMEFCLPGILQLGDVEDVVKLVAPRALLLQATADDKWSRGAEAMFAYAQSAFPKGNLVLGYWPGDHVFTPEMRENAYRFLDQHLNQPQG
jgi:dienelactone hydrolase